MYVSEDIELTLGGLEQTFRRARGVGAGTCRDVMLVCIRLFKCNWV